MKYTFAIVPSSDKTFHCKVFKYLSAALRPKLHRTKQLLISFFLTVNVFTGGRGQASHAPLSSVPAHSPWQHESHCTTYIVLFIGGPSRTSVLIKMIKFFGSGKKTVRVYNISKLLLLFYI